jgi:serine/threonine protein kinase
VTKLLGKGTTAKVYAATKKSNGQSFAVKIFDKSKFAETDKVIHLY